MPDVKKNALPKYRLFGIMTAGLMLFLLSLACQALFPRAIPPGSLEAEIAEGNIKFTGRGNVSYIGCQDPSAVVEVVIGPKTKEYQGQEFNVFVNPVTVSAVTEGTQVKLEECAKSDLENKYNWPAEGLYYASEARIVFFSCTQNKDRAEGEAFLVGEGFEGEYACYDGDGSLIFSVAFSAYETSR